MVKNGGDIPHYYSLEYSGTTNASNAFTPLFNDEVKRTSYMHVPGGIFTQTSVYYRARAKNGVGFGYYGTILTVTCDTKPTGMNTPVLVETKPSSIAISWTGIPDTHAMTGGDPINFYSVEWSPNNSNWYALNNGGPLILSYNYTVSFIFNTTNQFFRLRA
jgi:hypothetical protein